MKTDIRTILYAADLAADCAEVLAYAIGIANRLGARLTVLTVIPEERERSLIEVDSYVPQETLNQYHDERARRVRQHIEDQLAAFYSLRPDKHGRPVAEVTVHEGDDVAQLILEEARTGSADLILMRSRTEGLLMGLLFGSVVQEVASQSSIPVLLVPCAGD